SPFLLSPAVEPGCVHPRIESSPGQQLLEALVDALLAPELVQHQGVPQGAGVDDLNLAPLSGKYTSTGRRNSALSAPRARAEGPT
ncbi:MAG: hypothetical protein ABSF27_01945, partial [Candidatus Dormibacteria bacterium]